MDQSSSQTKNQVIPIDSEDAESIGTAPPQRSVAAKAILAVVIALAIGGGGFEAGAKYGKSAAATPSNGAFRGNTTNMAAGTSGGAREGAIGTVSAVSASSITINDTRLGTTSTYKVTSATAVTDNGSVSNITRIATGDTVLIRSSTSDATTAASIRLNPTMGGFGSRGGGSAAIGQGSPFGGSTSAS